MAYAKKVAFRLMALVLAVLAVELLLSLAALSSSRISYLLTPPWLRAVVEPDEKLGHRMLPGYPGNDRRGYRNAEERDSCDVLVIGDSMTYGWAAPADKCWPRQLEARTGKTVYNMSCGAYGPCEYSVLLDRGLYLRPNTVIVGLYVGNDIAGAYVSVLVDKRAPELYPQDPAVLEEIKQADRSGTLRELAGRHFGTSPALDSDVSPLRGWLSRSSRVYGLLRALYAAISQSPYLTQGEDADQHPFETSGARPGYVAFDAEPRFRTVFQPPEGYVLSMNLADPRIREGKRITEAVLLSMQTRLRAQSIRFMVLLIPTKYMVYRPLVERYRASVPASLFDLLEHETRLTAELEAFLRNHGIEYVDSAAALRAGFDRGQRPYPQSSNTHPNESGYAALAEALVPILSRTGP